MDAARGEVGGHQHVPALFLELLQGLLARALAQAAVERGGEHVAFVQLGRQVLGGVLAGHEDQHALPAVVLDELAQQLGPALVVDLKHALLDHRRVARHGRHIDPLRGRAASGWPAPRRRGQRWPRRTGSGAGRAVGPGCGPARRQSPGRAGGRLRRAPGAARCPA